MLIVGVVPFLVLRGKFAGFLDMYNASAEGLAARMLTETFWMTAYTLVPIFAVAAFDLRQSRYACNENIKMTKDERKQAEGDPLIKAQQRKKMLQMASKRMLRDAQRPMSSSPTPRTMWWPCATILRSLPRPLSWPRG